MQHVAEGNTDVDAIAKAIEAAKAVTDKPSIIEVTTTIGYGSPNKADTAGVHGAALGEEEAALTRSNWVGTTLPKFPRTPTTSSARPSTAAPASSRWNRPWRTKYPSEAAEFERMLRGELPEGWDKDLPTYTPDGGLATRKHSQICLGALGPNLPELIGGSADLTHSNYTDIKGETGSYQASSPEKRYLHFGVREHAMAAILNGIAYTTAA